MVWGCLDTRTFAVFCVIFLCTAIVLAIVLPVLFLVALKDDDRKEDTLPLLGQECNSEDKIPCFTDNAECTTLGTGGVCDCKADYYDDNGQDVGGNCRPIGKLGDECLYGFPVSCSTTNAECSTSQRCVCLSGYYDDNGAAARGNCEEVKSLGEACDATLLDVQVCSDANSGCSISSNQCECSLNYYENPVLDVCLPVGYLDDACTFGISASCADSSLECTFSNLCACVSGYYDNNGATTGGTCLPIGDLGDPWTYGIAESCSTLNSECNSNDRCVCSSEYYDNNGDADGGDCNQIGELHEPCTYGIEESCSVRYSECSLANICVCKSGFYDDNAAVDGGSCLEIGDLHESCTYGLAVSCGTQNAECSILNVCVCSTGYYDTNVGSAGGNCNPVGTQLGDACTFGVEESCSLINSYCGVHYESICVKGYYDHNGGIAGGQCATVGDLGDQCYVVDGACGTKHALCDSSSETCVCASGYVQRGNQCSTGYIITGPTFLVLVYTLVDIFLQI